MSQTLFAPPRDALVPIAGDTRLFPIRRIFCVGRNYAAHAREMGVEADRDAPFYFTKSRDAYTPSGATIPYPPGTRDFHYEMELVVALGGSASGASAESALSAVFGYACGLDMTRRDLQQAARLKQRPWDIGKDFENAAVLAPIVPASVCGHIERGAISLKLNGELRQSGDIADLIHSVPAIITHLSHYYHLDAGDLIYTGTPEGVGAVAPGDRIEGAVEGVGEIALSIAAAEA